MEIPYESEFSLELTQKFDSTIQSILKVLKKNLKDKTISLETRWEAYLILRKYLDVDSSYWTPDSVKEEISWYDDFYLERSEVQELDADFVKEVLEKFPDTDENELKEEILQYGYGGFENDW